MNDTVNANLKSGKVYKNICLCLVMLIALAMLLFAMKIKIEEHIVINQSQSLKGSEIKLFSSELLLPGDYTCTFKHSGADRLELQIVALGSYDFNKGDHIAFERAFDGFHDEDSFSFTVDQPCYMVNGYITSETNNAQIDNFVLKSDNPVYKNTVLVKSLIIRFAIVFFTISAWLIYTEKYSIFIALSFSVAIGVLACLPYIMGRPRYGDDYAFHFNRIHGIALYIKNGTIPGRINAVFNSGYGYANSIMYPELLLYIAGAFVAMGMEGNLALVLFSSLCNILTALIATYSFATICENMEIGIALSAVYTLFFYRLQNIYMRSAIGEVVFMIFLPLAVCALYKLMENGGSYWALLALAMTGILQSHIIGSLFSVIILVVEFLIIATPMINQKRFQIRIILDGIKAVAFTVLLNIWFFAPFLFFYITQDFIMFDEKGAATTFIENLVPLKSFLSISANSIASHRVMGILLYIALAMRVFGIYWSAKNKKSENIFISSFFLAVALIFGVMCTNLTSWEKLFEISLIKKLMTKIQFPFRIYTLFAISICMAVCFALRKYNSKKVSIVWLTAVGILSVWSCVMFYNSTSDSNYVTAPWNPAPIEYMMQGADIMPEILTTGLKSSDNIQIIEYEKEDTTVNVTYFKDSAEDGIVKLPLFYYYGYKAINDNGYDISLVDGENGTLAISDTSSESGVRSVKVFYDNNRKIFKYPLILSIVSTVVFPFFVYYDWKRRKI